MLTYRVDLDAGRILGGEEVLDSSKPPPLHQGVAVPATGVALELARGKRDLFQWSYQTLIRRDATTGLVIWDVSRPAKPYEHGRDPAKWLWLFTRGHRELSIVAAAPDLDGDGTGDIVCAFRRVPALLALSGTDGSVLWSYLAELDGSGRPQPDGPKPDNLLTATDTPGFIIGTPAVAKCDGDLAPDLVVSVGFAESAQELMQRARQEQQRQPQSSPNPPVNYRRTMVGISGRTGRGLWSYRVDPAFTPLPRRTWNPPGDGRASRFACAGGHRGGQAVGGPRPGNRSAPGRSN